MSQSLPPTSRPRSWRSRPGPPTAGSNYPRSRGRGITGPQTDCRTFDPRERGDFPMNDPESEDRTVTRSQVDGLATPPPPDTVGSALPPADGPALAFLAPAQRPDEIGRLGKYRVLAELGR